MDPGVTYRSAMGDFGFDGNGDTTLRIITIYGIGPSSDWQPLTYINVPGG